MRPSARCGLLCGWATAAALLMGAADGSWLRRVPPGDRAQASPLGDQAAAAGAGEHLYSQHCATCHGAEGLGKPGRPPVVSDRVGQATDGELEWLMKNGNPWKGMPSWNALPTAQRWQLVAYLRRLNTPAPDQSQKQSQSHDEKQSQKQNQLQEKPQ